MSSKQILVAQNAVDEERKDFICQIQTIPQTALYPDNLSDFASLRGRTIRFIKRRMYYLKNFILGLHIGNPQKQEMTAPRIIEHLQPGDFVQVKSREAIQKTLNRWNCLDGCGFMEEMWPYCGTQQQVLKRVRQFMDERDYHIKRGKNLVILKDVCCLGTIDFGPCDRNCYFFWKEEWLEKKKEEVIP